MQIERRTAHIKRIATTTVTAILFLSALAPATAQVRPGPVSGTIPIKIRQAISGARFEPSTSTTRKQRGPVPHAVQGQLRPATRGMWVAVGAVAGGVAAATLVAEAGDPENALRGVVIGLPIGAALGGFITWRLTR